MGFDSSEVRERRRYHRRSVRVPVDYSSVDAFFSEFASNINEGGLFVETDVPQEPGESVKLLIRLPRLEQSLEVEGRVVWVSEGGDAGSPAGMGVEFQNLPEDVRTVINELVRELRISSPG